jgi:uncharacterized protein DUF6502
MTRVLRRGSPHPRLTESEGVSRECLARLARILVHSGHSPDKLVRQLRDICRQLKQPALRWDPTRLAYFADLPHVISQWHADPLYLDSEGLPIALPLGGTGPSLYALIARVLPGTDPRAVTRTLIRVRGISRRGRLYTPTGRYLVYQLASARLHALTALLGMLRTVERNVAGARRAPILERTAINPDFPARALPAFHTRLKALATEFLWNVDGDMRRREGGTTRGPRTRLGVGVFAFEEPVQEATRSGVGEALTPRIRRPPRRSTVRRPRSRIASSIL